MLGQKTQNLLILWINCSSHKVVVLSMSRFIIHSLRNVASSQKERDRQYSVNQDLKNVMTALITFLMSDNPACARRFLLHLAELFVTFSMINKLSFVVHT